jgi:Alginate lyase
MNHLVPAFTALCLVLGACSGGSSGDDSAASPQAGSAGSESVSSGGASAMGGASAAAGATSASAGTGASAGADANGGATAGGASNTSGTGGSNAAGGDGAMAGSSAAAGSGATAGGGAGGGASAIDYSIWLLQLPTGTGTSPNTVAGSKLASYSDAYFYKASDGGQAFMDPATGITTSGSVHCRTEMRESTPGGGQAAWSSSGTNTMTVTGAVMLLGKGTSGNTTVGQLFNGTDSIPLIELQYNGSKGGFELLYEEAKGGGSETDLKTPVALSKQYTFTLALTQGVVTVTINGKPVYTHAPTAATLAKSFYFKVGDYDQTAAAGAISTTPYTIVEAYSVAVVHN